MARQRQSDNIDFAVRGKFKQLASLMAELRVSKAWEAYEQYLIDYEINHHLRAIFTAKNEAQRIEAISRVKQSQEDLIIPHLIMAIATEKDVSKSAPDIKRELTNQMAWRYIPQGGSLFALFHNVGEEDAKGEEESDSVQPQTSES